MRIQSQPFFVTKMLNFLFDINQSEPRKHRQSAVLRTYKIYIDRVIYIYGTRLDLTLSQTTNFRLFHAVRVCRQFQVYWKWHKAVKTGKTHCGKRRNCSLREMFPFPSVFKRRVLQTRKNQGLFGKGLSHSHTMTPFDASGKQAFWKHCGKRRNCSYRAISPFPTLFSTCSGNFLPFSSNLKLSSANSLNLEESKICRLVMG